MLLLTELTSTPNETSIGIKYCQKVSEKSIIDTNTTSLSLALILCAANLTEQFYRIFNILYILHTE